jgi:hypothetical protein
MRDLTVRLDRVSTTQSQLSGLNVSEIGCDRARIPHLREIDKNCLSLRRAIAAHLSIGRLQKPESSKIGNNPNGFVRWLAVAIASPLHVPRRAIFWRFQPPHAGSLSTRQ